MTKAQTESKNQKTLLCVSDLVLRPSYRTKCFAFLTIQSSLPPGAFIMTVSLTIGQVPGV